MDVIKELQQRLIPGPEELMRPYWETWENCILYGKEHWAAHETAALAAGVPSQIALKDAGVLNPIMERELRGLAEDDSPTYTDPAATALQARGWERINDPRTAKLPKSKGVK